MASTYSERFLQAHGTGVVTRYTVPAGHRAVLRMMSASTGDPATS